jgi:PAS domain S-box-containing protein
MKFSLKLALALLCAALVPLAVVTLALARARWQTYGSATPEAHLVLSQTLTQVFQRLLQQTREDLLSAGEILNAPSLQEKDAVAILDAQLRPNPLIRSIGVYTESGVILEILTKEQGAERLFPDTLSRALLEPLHGQRFVSEIWWKPSASDRDENSSSLEREAYLPVAARIAGKRFSGILLVLLTARDCRRILTAPSLQAFGLSRGAVYCLDEHFRLVASTERETANYRKPIGEIDSALRRQFPTIRFDKSAPRADTLSTELASFYSVGVAKEYTRADGEEIIVTLAPVPFANIALAIEQPKSVAYKSLYDANEQILIIGGLAAVFAVVFAVALARQLGEPLRNLKNAAFAMAGQNFGFRLPARRHDEFAPIFGAYNVAAERLEYFQRLNVQQTLAERNKLEAIMRQSTEGIVIIAPEQTITLANDAFARFTGKESEAVEGRSLEQALEEYPELTELLAAAHRKAQELSSNGGGDSAVEENLHKRADISLFAGRLFHIVVTPIFLDGRYLALLAILADVTKERELEEMKTDIVRMVAHELRAPLGSILGLSEAVAEGHVETLAQAQEFNVHIFRQTKRLRDIINDYLDISRLESGESFERRRCRIENVIAEAVDDNAQLAAQKGITVRRAVAPDVGEIWGNERLLAQVVVNLFSNACKYSPPQTNVTLEAYNLDAERVYVAVRDEGYGIQPEAQNRLFTKFYRAENDKRVSAELGTGLGLAYVKEIIERHGGSIGVQSVFNVGSTFWFTLPRYVESKVFTLTAAPTGDKG